MRNYVRMKHFIFPIGLICFTLSSLSAQILERSYFHCGYNETLQCESVVGEAFNNVYSGDIIVYETMLISDLSSTALPVKLIEFNAQYEQPNAVLNWKIANEGTLEFYIIEKSEDASSFYEIGNVKAKGDNSIFNFYHLQNESKSFYRLKMKEQDDLYYSDVKSVLKNTKDETLKIYPNPIIQDYFYFENSTASIIELYNIEGKQVKKQNIQKGKNKIDIKDLTNGIYILKTNNNQSIKIIKQ